MVTRFRRAQRKHDLVRCRSRDFIGILVAGLKVAEVAYFSVSSRADATEMCCFSETGSSTVSIYPLRSRSLSPFVLSAGMLDRKARGVIPSASRNAREKFEGSEYPSALAMSSIG